MVHIYTPPARGVNGLSEISDKVFTLYTPRPWGQRTDIKEIIPESSYTPPARGVNPSTKSPPMISIGGRRQMRFSGCRSIRHHPLVFT